MMFSIRIQGMVQGVGFRPFVWHLAKQVGVTGKVWNDAHGVMIHACGDDEVILNHFCDSLWQDLPPLARIDEMVCTTLDDDIEAKHFVIVASDDSGKTNTVITPDAAVCSECAAEIFDNDDRHFNYPFTSCTHCGPRLSIVSAVPYDRANTSMSSFPMCTQCQAEYDDPQHRRFHAQTNACPARFSSICGPSIWLEDHRGKRLTDTDAKKVISKAVSLLKSGSIVAIKGIGGIHLAVDASNAEAVNQLRRRKQRDAKPFALMAKDLKAIENYVFVNEAEAALLQSAAAPIVLLAKNSEAKALAMDIAPNQSRLGFMLPYSPLHLLLMAQLDNPIVLTSGNISDEPQCIDNDEARQQLEGIMDYFLLHDRDIVNRLDDSVAMVCADKPRLLRRARGFAPASILLNESFKGAENVLGMGAELKNTFCLLRDGQAIVSQHIGDLEHASAFANYRAALDLYQQMYDFQPATIAVDQHPDYFSTQHGHKLADETGTPVVCIQHHHAHIAAVLAEHHYGMACEPVLGICLDGLGFGDDRTLWGGEFLLADFCEYQRLGCFQPVAMPGGTQAIREPWRNTFAQLKASDWDVVAAEFEACDIIGFLNEKPQRILHSMIDRDLNSPLSSSCGRLFDAVAAALNICREAISYEGQAAIELEALAQTVFANETSAYPFQLDLDSEPAMIHWQPMWGVLLTDLTNGVSSASIAARFHRTVIAAIKAMTLYVQAQHHCRTVVLCGGAFQNRLLLETLSSELQASGLSVLSAEQLPINDGGLSLGQACIAAAQQEEANV